MNAREDTGLLEVDDEESQHLKKLKTKRGAKDLGRPFSCFGAELWGGRFFGFVFVLFFNIYIYFCQFFVFLLVFCCVFLLFFCVFGFFCLFFFFAPQ